MSKFMKSLCKIAIPVTLQSMLQASFSIVDQIMIGQLGETNISAVGLCGNFSLIFSVVIGAVSTVAGILIAQFIGAEDTKEAWCSFDVSLICGIMISALFLFAAGFFPSWILSLYTKDVSIVNTGAVYFRIVAFSYIPMAVSNILSSWLRCKEHATIPFLASFGAVAVNTGLNYLLIFGKFGLPCMGIKGAAIATLISQLFNLIVIVIGFALCIRKDGDKPVWSLHFSKITIKDYLIMIMPILISEFLWSLGQNYGAGKYQRIKKSAIVCNVISASVIMVISAVILMFGRTILGIFCRDENVIRLGLQIIGVSFPFYFIYSIMEVTGGLVRGVGKTIQSMIIVIVTLCICRIGILKLFVDQFHSLRMVAAVYPITWSLAMLAFIICFVDVSRKMLKKQ